VPGLERDGLVLTGTVAQVSYPGGLWRHVVHLGDTSLIVDSVTRFEEGAPVEITVPEPALYIFPHP
jgi:putative spermidine/putrescine transport system ATP-binding protein